MAELGIEIPEGQPGELEGGAAGLRGAAGAMQTAEASLTNAGQVAEWSGQANASYLDAVAQQAQSAAVAAGALDRAAVAIEDAARALEEARADAKAALADARDAQDRIERAREAIDDAQARASEAQAAIDTADHQIASSSVHGAPDPGAVAARAQASDAFFAAKDDEERARRQLEEAQEDLERARERAREANERWETASARAAASVESLGAFTYGGTTVYGTPAPAVGGALPGSVSPLLTGRRPLTWSEWKTQRSNPLLTSPFGPLGTPGLDDAAPLTALGYGANALQGSASGARGAASHAGRTLSTSPDPAERSAAAKALPSAGRTAGTLSHFARPLPLVGPGLEFTANKAEGRSTGEAAVHTALSGAGAAIGAGVVGTACTAGTLGIGTPACVGLGAGAGVAGGWLGDKAADIVDGPVGGAIDDLIGEEEVPASPPGDYYPPGHRLAPDPHA